MEYRVNFFAGLLVDVIFLFDKIIYAYIVYRLDISIYGLTPDQIALFIGSYAIVLSIYCAVFLVNINMTLPSNIKSGNLDVILTKPISAQFFLSTSYVEYATMVPDLVGGILIVVCACSKMSIEVSPFIIGGYVFFILVSVSIIYALYFSIQLIAFRITDTSAIGGILNTILDLNNMPIHVYGKKFQFMFIYLFPVLLFGNVAPLFLIKQLKLSLALWSIFIAIMLVIMSRYLWKYIVKQYTSVNG